MKRQLLLLAFSALLAITTFAQVSTARQLYDEYHANGYTFEKKYLNQTITFEGKIRSLKQGVKGLNAANAVFITATGFENFAVCQFPLEDLKPLESLKADDVVRVTGKCTMITRDAMMLANCSFQKVGGAAVAKKTAPAQIPLGTYKIYQANGNTFNYQYTFTLNSHSAYTIGNQKGAVNYDAKKGVIHFASGKLKGFTGIYRPVNPDNPNDPPTIVLDVKGSVPDLKNAFGKTYLLAYWQQ
jgi:tRNA_anti-like